MRLEQEEKPESITIDAGESIDVSCSVTIPNLKEEDIKVEAYCGKVSAAGRVEDVIVVPMKLDSVEEEYNRYHYKAKLELKSGGNYGYTFRVLPKNKMLLDSENLDLIKWVTK